MLRFFIGALLLILSFLAFALLIRLWPVYELATLTSGAAPEIAVHQVAQGVSTLEDSDVVDDRTGSTNNSIGPTNAAAPTPTTNGAAGEESGNAEHQVVRLAMNWGTFWPCKICDELPTEPRTMLIILLAGGIGSAVYVATSFSSFVGNRTFQSSWGWWYFLRLPIGMGLALIFYLLVRSGLDNPLTEVENTADMPTGPFGLAAIAAMAGMFSKQAADKLNDLFETLFRSDENAKRADKLKEEAPEIRSIEPPETLAGTNDPTIRIMGTGFTESSEVRVNEKIRPSSFDKETNVITTTLAAEDIKTEGDLSIEIINTSAQGGKSKSFTHKVVKAPQTP
ncbi:hypothetical protein [Pseudoruegeria sp. HB172150]|uniref:hypothetical protein n=1 Tax=Pseudoruegeria sp. HB172150 TaxID=2721164 RepID=UPI001551CCC2|nr:hypothetical protein [Pseudoruegeria sp. HB172150]